MELFTGESVIMDSYFSLKQQFEVINILIIDLLTNTQLFASQTFCFRCSVAFFVFCTHRHNLKHFIH